MSWCNQQQRVLLPGPAVPASSRLDDSTATLLSGLRTVLLMVACGVDNSFPRWSGRVSRPRRPSAWSEHGNLGRPGRPRRHHHFRQEKVTMPVVGDGLPVRPAGCGRMGRSRLDGVADLEILRQLYEMSRRRGALCRATGNPGGALPVVTLSCRLVTLRSRSPSRSPKDDVELLADDRFHQTGTAAGCARDK